MPLPESSISLPNGQREKWNSQHHPCGRAWRCTAKRQLGFKRQTEIGDRYQLRHTDGWRNTDMQWDQNQLKPGSTMLTVNRSSTTLFSENLEWQVKQKTEPHRRRNVLRTLGDAHGPWKYLRPTTSTTATILLPPGKQVQAERAQLPHRLSYGRYGYFTTIS